MFAACAQQQAPVTPPRRAISRYARRQYRHHVRPRYREPTRPDQDRSTSLSTHLGLGPDMTNADEKQSLGPVAFTFGWLGIAVIVVFIVAVVAGLLRDDVAGTMGPVVMWGMLFAAIAVVVALFQRGHRS